jgi:hypothetical protein
VVDKLGHLAGNETKERVDGCEALIARRDGIAALLLEVSEEGTGDGGRDLLDRDVGGSMAWCS